MKRNDSQLNSMTGVKREKMSRVRWTERLLTIRMRSRIFSNLGLAFGIENILSESGRGIIGVGADGLRGHSLIGMRLKRAIWRERMS